MHRTAPVRRILPARRAIHEREIGRIRAIAGEVPLRLVECSPTVIRGLEALAELGGRLWS